MPVVWWKIDWVLLNLTSPNKELWQVLVEGWEQYEEVGTCHLAGSGLQHTLAYCLSGCSCFGEGKTLPTSHPGPLDHRNRHNSFGVIKNSSFALWSCSTCCDQAQAAWQVAVAVHMAALCCFAFLDPPFCHPCSKLSLLQSPPNK